jgi:hypothetical protein
MHIKSLKHVAAAAVFSLLCVPLCAQAAVITFDPEKPTSINVYIDPQHKDLNVVEGVIRFKGKAAEGLTVQVENGKSALPLWPVPPVYDEKEQVIRFTGGVPGGISKKSLLFRMKLSPRQSDTLEMSYGDGGAYLNDGKGTREEVSALPLSIHVDPVSVDDDGRISGDNNVFKGGIIIALIVVALIIARYGYKKFITHAS